MSVDQPSPIRVRFSVLAILSLLAVMAALVWWRVLRPHADPVPAPASAAKPAERRASDLSGMDRAQLLGAARAAMQRQRLVAPVGDNAVAYYLQVLQDDPGNRAATDALRELFPFAAQAVEQTINVGQLDDAQRELDLLARVDPTNYTLTLLRAKLGDRRRVLATAAVPVAPPAASSGRALNAVAAATQPQVPVATAPAPPAPAAPKRAAAPVPAVVAGTPAARVVPKQTIERTAPLLVFQMPPYYPASARRQHRQGWVEVRYTVNPDGHVSGARVVRGKPGHLFDHAALTAVERWRFKPGTLDGRPVAVTVTSRVDFRLPN